MENPSILIVEDESIVALEIESVLQRLGYDVCGQVRSGEDAVFKTGTTKPDLVLMDINLKSAMDGIDAAEIIRYRHNIPVVYLTAYASDETLERAKKTEPLGYIQKPFKEESLKIALEMAFYTAGIEAERQQMVNRLKISEQRFQDMFNSAIDGYAVHEMLYDKEGNTCDYRFMNVNPAFERITGLKADEVLGKTVLEVMPGTEKNWIERYGEVVRTGQPISFSSYSAELGKHFNVSAYRIGQSLFAVSFVDITERKQGEERLARESRINSALAKISTELISSGNDIQTLARLVLDQSKTVTGSTCGFTTIIDPQTGERHFYTHSSAGNDCKAIEELKNSAVNNKTDMSSGATLHPRLQPHSFFNNQPDEYSGSARSLLDEFQVNNFLSVPVFLEKKISGQIVLANSDGGYVKHDLKAVEQIGELYALAIQSHRVKTERKNLQDQMRQMQKMEAIGTLAGGIAHDFNNILQPILGYSYMLKKVFHKTDKGYKYISSIINASMRARELVQQILTFARKSEQELQPVEVQLITKEAVRLLRSSLPSTIQINQQLEIESGLVMADPTKIHQIIMNLATNALHAMQEQGGTMDIHLKAVKLEAEEISETSIFEEDFLCLTVADSGIGMEKSVLDKIFDPYFTTKGQSKGTGLGLSVVMGIVKSFGGFIKVQSEVGVGTEFNVFLPLATDEPVKTQVESDAIFRTGDERILLVDDESSVIELLKNMLEELGYEVTDRISSVGAFELFKRHADAFDLVVTDMTMPNMTGTELAKKLLSIRPDIPIVLCTGYSELINEEKAASIGIKKMLMKPVSQFQMGKAIREVLDETPPSN